MMRVKTRESHDGEGWDPLLIRVARGILWFVVLTASFKFSEIFGPGEQFLDATPTLDVLFRAGILGLCLVAAAIAMVTGKLQRRSLSFVPFLLWAFAVTVMRQSDFASAKQLGSYASWILFYIGASALLGEAGDYRRLASVLVASVVLSALGGEFQHLLGYGPSIGARWPDLPGMEFMRTHTGSGGILLDAFTPYCAAILLLSTPGSLKRQALAWVLVLWGTANILRGGLLALCVALAWYTAMAPRVERRRILVSVGLAAVLGVMLFGGTIASKIGDSDDGFNTSGRFDVWPMLTGWIAEDPLIGHGPDADLTLLANSAAGRDLRAAHNELLSTGVNYGLPGILFVWIPLLWLLIYSIRQSFRVTRSARDSSSGATAVLLMITILGLTDNTLRTPGVMILALAPTAVVIAGRRERSEERFFAEALYTRGVQRGRQVEV